MQKKSCLGRFKTKKLQEEIEVLRQDNSIHLMEIQGLLTHIMNLEDQAANLDEKVSELLETIEMMEDSSLDPYEDRGITPYD